MCLVEKAVDVGAMKNALIITTKDKVYHIISYYLMKDFLNHFKNLCLFFKVILC